MVNAQVIYQLGEMPIDLPDCAYKLIAIHDKVTERSATA